MSFKDKAALVTGSSGGIGATTAIQFAKVGALVVIVGRNKAKLKNVKETCEKYGPTSLVIKADVSIDGDVKRIMEETIEKYSQIDVLIKNAETVESADITSNNSMNLYDLINNVNLRGVVYITHLAIPYLVKSKGNIVNQSSITGIRTLGMPKMIPYQVSKAGLNHFTRTAAMNLASCGMRVNSISPGLVWTDIIDRHSVEPATWETFAQMTALKCVSESEKADLIIYLASDKARGITGSDYVSDNGINISSYVIPTTIFIWPSLTRMLFHFKQKAMVIIYLL